MTRGLGTGGQEDRALQLEVSLQEALLAHEVAIEKRVKKLRINVQWRERVAREVEAWHSRRPYSTTTSQTGVLMPGIPLPYANVAVQSQ